MAELTFFCGKMGAGKSTRARTLADRDDVILISEDAWLAGLYPGQVQSLEDYLRCSAALMSQIKPLVQSLLVAGVDVVMDFPANTVRQRGALKAIADEVGAQHRLQVIDTPDQVCLERIRQRALDDPSRQATDTESMFAATSAHFTLPSASEGLRVG